VLNRPFTIKLSTPCWAVTLLLLAAFQCIVGVRAEAQEIKIDSAHLGVYVYNATNAYRQSKGLERLRLGLNGPAGNAAQKYAEYQASTNTTGHQADGRTPDQRIKAEGAEVCAWAENVFESWTWPNVATIQEAANGAMQFWKTSPGHEQNLRTDKSYILGVGAAAWKHETRNYYKVVQVFLDDCKPVSERNVKKLGKKPPKSLFVPLPPGGTGEFLKKIQP
jgi:uncharacterized protein YkwD